jgi:hypothetical protein
MIDTDTATYNGITLNTLEVARGLYEMFDDKAKRIMSMGMVDKRYTDMLDRQLAEQYAECHRKTCLDRYGLATATPVCEHLQKEFVKTMSAAVVKKLYSVAVMKV